MKTSPFFPVNPDLKETPGEGTGPATCRPGPLTRRIVFECMARDTRLHSLLVLTLLAFAFTTHAEPPELKQHRDAKSKQDLKQVLDRQDGNLEWRLKHFDTDHDGVLDQMELATELPLNPKGMDSLAPARSALRAFGFAEFLSPLPKRLKSVPKPGVAEQREATLGPRHGIGSQPQRRSLQKWSAAL